MRFGFGGRLFIGIAGVVVVMLVIAAAIFASLFPGYRDRVDSSELLAAGNSLSSDIVRSLRDVPAQSREPAVDWVYDEAKESDLVVILTDGEGRTYKGFEDAEKKFDAWGKFTFADIVRKAGPNGWFRTELKISGKDRESLFRVVIPPSRRGGQSDRGVLLGIAFGAAGDGPIWNDEFVQLAMLSGFVGLGFAVLIALVLSRQMVRPLESLTGVVRKFGPDRYDMRATEDGPTQVRELAAAFNAMAERVADNERAMRGLLADVSHELRTPLTSIRGFVEALRDGTVDDEQRRASSLEAVHGETQRMLRMIEQLLDLSRLEAGEYRLQLTKVEPDELRSYIESMFKARASEQDTTISYNFSKNAPTIEADYDRIVQVLNNLLDNAIRHTKEGEIKVTAQEVEGGLELTVQDTGEGIEGEDLLRLFDRFWQPQSRTGPGAGLGLAITREIVRAHKGHIAAQSQKGEGATITIWLPASQG